MTHALIRKSDGGLECFVDDLTGIDLDRFTVIAAPADWLNMEWDGAALKRRTIPIEETLTALNVDPRWVALRSASPSQVQDWMTTNVTDLASARRVLTALVLAVQYLSRSR